MASMQLLSFLLVVLCLGSSSASGLGSACSKDRHCKVDNSQCSSGVCACKHYHAQLGTTACLESKLLGRECIVSEQCSLRVANSTCTDGHCHCSEGFVKFRKHTCLGPAKVGDVCYGDEHCQLWAKNSHCKFLIPKLFGKCTCDGEGNCAPDEPSKPPAPNPSETPQANTTETTKPAAESTDGGADTAQDTKNTTGNDQPEETSAGFVDPFLRQKEHHLTTEGTSASTGSNAEADLLKEDEQATEVTGTESATEGGNGHGHTEVAEGSKYRVEVSEKDSEGSAAESRAVEAVSLGYPCRSDVECQKKDGGSRCVNGVCDCVAKSNSSDSCGRERTGCGPETFQCRASGQCVSWFFVCDGRSDCPDNSDEDCRGPECPHPSFKCGTTGTCVSLAAVCDGTRNCPDGEDERLCSPADRNSTQGCPDSTFQCADGQCLPKFEFCNAIPKCADGSDELPHLCSSQANRKPSNRKREPCPFECGNGRCRSTAIVCSGRDGCGDNSDEAHCSVCRCPQIPPVN